MVAPKRVCSLGCVSIKRGVVWVGHPSWEKHLGYPDVVAASSEAEEWSCMACRLGCLKDRVLAGSSVFTGWGGVDQTHELLEHVSP